MKNNRIHFYRLLKEVGDFYYLPLFHFLFSTILVENTVQNLENFKFRYLIIRFSACHGRINGFML